ncbi:MAG: hypothetical protein KKA73_00525 [Chloroflexi bacterium]|nr:hypothetical protein [Chloroflexota bacterium]MBU1746146.1 hypothetical protein [Chloroflexota bacterium]
MSQRHHLSRALALLLAGTLLVSALVAAYPYPPAWRDASAGLRRTAAINALAASADRQTVYAISYQPNGLARSTDSSPRSEAERGGGRTWQRAALLGDQAVPLSVAVTPDDPDRVVVGLVDGARWSTNGGATWTDVPALAGLSVNAWLFAPDGLYAGTSAGLRASTDGGDTWHEVPGAPDDAVLCLLLDPADPNVLYVGTDRGGVYVREAGNWRGGGQGHANALAGDPATGAVYAVALHRIFRTTDHGRTWQDVPWPADVWAPLTLAVASTPAGPVLYAGAVENSGLYRSTDEGSTWQRLDGPTAAGYPPLHGATALSLLALDADRVLVGTDGIGLLATANGGETWQPVDVSLGTPRLAAILPHPTRPGVAYAGAADGVYRSTDGGDSWQLVTGALGRLDVLALAVHPLDPNTVYAGTTTGVYRSTDGGNFWHPWMTGIENVTIYSFTFHPTDPAIIYAGSRGNNVCRTTNGGVSWAPIHNGLETLTAFDVLVDARNPQVLTIGTVEGIYRSGDGGESWEKLALGELSIFDLAEAGGFLYAGTTDGVYVSRDGGSTWAAQRQEMGAQTVIALLADPGRPGVLYAGTIGAGVYRSDDGGVTWRAWSRNLAGATIYDLALDPFDEQRLYAATDQGAFTLTLWVP